MAYLPLSTANLPDPAIDPAQGSSPQDYFNTLAYDGTGVNPTTHTGVGFQPDFVWMHPRSRADNHNLFNVLSGAGQRLNSNNTSAETFTTHFISFDSDGFTTTADSGYNKSGDTYVAWNWKANGSGVSNTDGSITSTVSANTESGFSIVSYTGTGSAGTVGHGLNQKPEAIFFKNRDDAGAFWYVYHHSVPTGSNSELQVLYLNDPTAASEFGTGAFMNNTAPTTSVFSLDTNGGYNTNTEAVIAYCFHSVEGFSKIGSYTGNGSTDGPFVYTGFRPAFVMLKPTTNGDNWIIQDGIRETYNPSSKRLFPNLSNAEVDNPSAYSIDFLSNGFKPVVSHTSTNQSGQLYIYMAFAENPFKYSNAR